MSTRQTLDAQLVDIQNIRKKSPALKASIYIYMYELPQTFLIPPLKYITCMYKKTKYNFEWKK
jgi:hypothetical protein